jgi:hypothetical protein
VTDKQQELEAFTALGETCLWTSALVSDAEDEEEISNLQHVLSEEIDRFLSLSSQPVHVSARQAIAALEERAAGATRIQCKGLRVRS